MESTKKINQSKPSERKTAKVQSWLVETFEKESEFDILPVPDFDLTPIDVPSLKGLSIVKANGSQEHQEIDCSSHFSRNSSTTSQSTTG